MAIYKHGGTIIKPITNDSDCCCCGQCSLYCLNDESPCEFSLEIGGVANGNGDCGSCAECNSSFVLPFIGIGDFGFCEWSDYFLLPESIFGAPCTMGLRKVYILIGLDAVNVFGFGINHYVLLSGISGGVCEAVFSHDLGTSLPNCMDINVSGMPSSGISLQCDGTGATGSV